MSLGDVKVQLPVDENTDPSSLHLSNCSVDSTILGKFPLFMSTPLFPLRYYTFQQGWKYESNFLNL